MSTWPFLRVSLPRDQPVRYLAFSFSSLSVLCKWVRVEFRIW